MKASTLAFGLALSIVGLSLGGASLSPVLSQDRVDPGAHPPDTVPASGVSSVRVVLHGQRGEDRGLSKGGVGSKLVDELAVTPGQALVLGTLSGASGGAGAPKVNDELLAGAGRFKRPVVRTSGGETIKERPAVECPRPTTSKLSLATMHPHQPYPARARSRCECSAAILP